MPGSPGGSVRVLSCSLALLRVRGGLDERAFVVPLAPGPLGRRSLRSACEKERGTSPAVSREVLRPVGHEPPNANPSHARNPGPKASECSARHRGFEPLTYGSGGGRTALPAVSSASQASGIVGPAEPAQVHPSQGIAPIRTPFVTPVLQASGRSSAGGLAADEAGRLLSVRDVARRLGVSTATVYALCETGGIAHVRVMNAIRVAPEDVVAFVRDHRNGGA